MKNVLSITLRRPLYSLSSILPSRSPSCTCIACPTFATLRPRRKRYSTETTTRPHGPQTTTSPDSGISDDKEGTLNRSRTKEPKTESSTDSVCDALFAENPDTNMVFGPPDRMSNLRPRRYRTLDEKTASPEDVAWKKWREEVDKFNEDFWTTNNAKFQEAKFEYVKDVYTTKKKVTPEDLSIFYKKFLDESYERHMVYNRKWYAKNFAMVWFSWKSLWRRCFSRKVEEKKTQNMKST